MVGGKVHNTREGNAFFQEMTRGLSLHLLPRLRQLGNSNGWASISWRPSPISVFLSPFPTLNYNPQR